MSTEKKVRVAGTSPGKVEVVELPYPKLKDDGIIVRVELGGMCGTDLHVYEAGYGPHRISGTVEYPLLLGHEYIGVIEEKGKNADEAMFYRTEAPEVGDRIFWGLDHYCFKCDFETIIGWQQWCIGSWFYGFRLVEDGPYGAMGQYVYIEPETYIWKIPKDKVSAKQGVVIEPYIVGLRSVDRALTMMTIAEKEGIPATDVFAIYGAGTIGLCTLVALRNFLPEATIIQLDLHNHRLEMAKKLGADYTINVAETSRDERIKEIMDIATSLPRPQLGSRGGVDCVFDCTGRNANDVIPEGIEILRAAGVFQEVGAFVAKTTGTFTIDPHELCAREVIFSSNWAYPLSTIDKGVQQVMKGLFKRVNLEQIITHEHSLDEIQDGFEQMIRCEGIKHAVNPWK